MNVFSFVMIIEIMVICKSNLLVRYLGKLSTKSAFCHVSIETWDLIPMKNGRAQWKSIEVVI